MNTFTQAKDLRIPLIDQLMEAYGEFSIETLDRIMPLYDQNVVFVDPVETLTSRDALRRYFEAMCEGLNYCRFDFDDVVLDEGQKQRQAALFWRMSYSHPSLSGGRDQVLEGTSHIRFSDRIHYHRDYYDLGAMVYEKIPVIGFGVRTIKKRLEQK